MCFGTATRRADDRPETDCDVIAVRLLAIVVFEPVLSPTTSVFCLLITLSSESFCSRTTERVQGSSRRVPCARRSGHVEAVRTLCCVMVWSHTFCSCTKVHSRVACGCQSTVRSKTKYRVEEIRLVLCCPRSGR